MVITDAADAQGVNLHTVPAVPQLAGYSTGSGGVPWSAAQWAAHPDALRICQDTGATDRTADILDVETGAATYAECPSWAKGALASFHGASRPGQRSPAIYCSASNVTAVVNALIAGKVTSGVGLFVADWTNSRAAAIAVLNISGGPFPVIGVQYADKGTYDADVFLTSWLNNRSKKGTTMTMQPPPGQWQDAAAWSWKEAALIGTGLDGNLHVFTFDPASGSWTKTE